MTRSTYNLLALATIAMGSAQLLTAPVVAQIAPPTRPPSCCTSGDGNATCCGYHGCSADASSCEAK